MPGTINPFGKEIVRVEGDFCGRKLTMETGRLAFQASGAVLVTYGKTVILGVAGVADPVEGLDYFPLMVDYEEKMYAAGKISGSRFIKREGRPTDEATLISRLIDRPIRPLFPKSYNNEVQGIAMVLAYDPDNRPDITAMIAVSAALNIADTPFMGPIAGVRVGLIKDELILNPTTEQMKESGLDLVVAGTEDAIMMVEAGAQEVDEPTMVKALDMAHKAMQPAVALQNELAKKMGIKKAPYEEKEADKSIYDAVYGFVKSKVKDAVRGKDKNVRDEATSKLETEMLEALVKDETTDKKPYKEAFDKIVKKEVRRSILEDGIRPDGRKGTDIRPLSHEVGVLPEVHGSALFTRGETQALNIVTLAPLSYAQLLDSMDRDEEKTYIHHYNFPGFTVGEVQRPRSAGRREIGHGALAERALKAVIPSIEEFPYTIRVVTEIMSSNGSTSMAAVCSSTLSLMDAGVPIKRPVSGIAMGLVSGDDGKYVILSDIQGTEDFSGDMDFKVAGTEKGITALQMDMKIKGVSPELLTAALQQAKEGRQHILESMLKTLAEPRKDLAPNAPRVETVMINPDKVRDVIGKGGETINKIIDATGVEIDIRDGGMVMISSKDKESIEAAKKWVLDLTAEPEVGTIYTGEVVKILDFGAFVQIMPGRDGLVHVSQMSEARVNHPSDVVKEGDKVTVKLVAIDEQGRLNLTMKGIDQK